MRFTIAAFAISVAACALMLWPPRPARNDLRITFIDVGQADAILIQTPRGHAIMIDTGGRLEQHEAGDGANAAESVGEKIVLPFLIRQGIHHVDAILLTHPHGDHKDFRAHEARALINSSGHDFQNLAAAWRTHSRNQLWAVSALSRGCHAIL